MINSGQDRDFASSVIYAAIGVTVDGRKDVLGLTMGTGGGESFGTGTCSSGGIRPAA